MTFEKVKEIIELNLARSGEFVELESDLRVDLKLDSLDIVEIMMDLEDAFDLTIEDEDVENFKTVKNIVDYIDNVSVLV